MPNKTKNLIADAVGASASTRELAKFAQSVSILTDEELVDQFYSLTKEELTKLVPFFRALFSAIATLRAN